MGVSGQLEETSGRGVDPLDPESPYDDPFNGVFRCDNSEDLGVSILLPALLGVDFVIVGLRVSPV